MSDLIDRQSAIYIASGYCHPANIAKELAKLPSAQPEPCEDAISRQAAVDALMAWEEYSVWDEDCLKHRGEPFWVAPSDVIKQLPPAQPEQRWIPCSERLPNGQTEVIVSCRDDSADTIYRYTASGWITTDGEYWIVDNEINPYVIAWCELPEPYREEGE